MATKDQASLAKPFSSGKNIFNPQLANFWKLLPTLT